MKGKLHVIGFGAVFMLVGFVLGHQISESHQTCPVLCETECTPCTIQEPLEPLVEFVPQYIEVEKIKIVEVDKECYYEDQYNDGLEQGLALGEAKGRKDCNAEWQQYN